MAEPKKYQIKIRSLRENANLKSKDVAEHLGIQPTVYSRYERGENDMKPNQIVDICNLYKVSADYVLDLPEGRPYGNNHLRYKNPPISKFDQFKNEMDDLAGWMRGNKHIDKEAFEILIENIEKTYNELQGTRR